VLPGLAEFDEVEGEEMRGLNVIDFIFRIFVSGNILVQLLRSIFFEVLHI
jgi:hypothetical protein